jgi:hypothetical protein
MYKSNFMKILKPTKMQFSPIKSLSAIIILFTLILLFSNTAMAQEKIQMV